jgi:hypothetical protein
MKKTVYMFSFIVLLTLLVSCSKAQLKSVAEENLNIAVEGFEESLGADIELIDVMFISINWERTDDTEDQSVFYFIEYLNSNDDTTGYVQLQLTGNIDELLSMAYPRNYDSRSELDDSFDSSISAIESDIDYAKSGEDRYYSNITYTTGSIDVDAIEDDSSDKQ